MTETPIQNTPYSNRVNILAELWMNYRNDAEFQDFIEYNDLGLPLAYAIENNIVASTTLSENFINETYDLFVAGLGIEDNGFDNLDELFGYVEANQES